MRMVRRWSGLLTSTLALACIVLSSQSVEASTLISYETSGTIDSTGRSGTPIISFDSLGGANANFNSPSQFSLGDFQVAALPANVSTTYTNTPFHITFVVESVNGAKPDPNETPIVVNGVLNGTITGGSQSTVVATITDPGKLSFVTGDFTNTLTIPDLSLTIVPTTTNDGITTVQARLDTIKNDNPVPEPTTLALFVTTLTGLGLRRRLGKGRLV